jgi:hypothetical protein
MTVEPDADQLAEIAARADGADDGPVVMLNLHRYRSREAYGRYAQVAASVLAGLGGRVIWYAPTEQTVIGGADERYDEVIEVWYPSRAAFVALATDPRIQEVRADRVAGLERATLICFAAGPDPDAPLLVGA